MNEHIYKETEENLKTPSTEAQDEVRLLPPKEKLSEDDMIKLSTNRPRSIDLILNSIGYTKYHFIMIFCCGLTYFSEGDVLFSLNMLMPTLKLIFSNESETWNTLLASALFFGYVCGTFFTGFLTRTVGRRTSINVCLLIFSLLSVGICLVENVRFMTICRFLIGMTMGIVLPQFIANLSEFLPSENKELVIMSMYIFYRVGIIYFIMCFSIAKPNQDKSKWKEAFLIAAIPVIFVTILTSIFFKDSPKLLLSKNQLTEAVETINYLQGKERNDHDSRILYALNEDMNQINGKNVEFSFFNIFSKDYACLTILTSLIFLATSMVNVIQIYALPIILVRREQHFEEHKEFLNNHNMAEEMLLTQVVTIPSILLSAFICKFIGRKNTIMIGLLLCSLATCVPAYFGKKIIISSTLVNFFIIFGQCTIKVYVIEAFPTRLRDYALSFCYFLSKLGDAFTPLLCNISLNMYLYGPMVIANILCIIGSISAFLLPFDTLGLNVD